MKKLLTLVWTVCLTICMTCSVFAGTTNIIVDGKDTGSSYEAYRLLDVEATTGSGATATYSYKVNATYTAVLQSVTGKSTDADIIAYIAKLNAAETRTFADAVYAQVKDMKADVTTSDGKFAGVAQGYYLIAEKAAGAGGTTSLVMLSTAGETDVTVKTKESVPTVVKKIRDTNDTTGITSDWQDSADADIGDALEYQLTGTVADEIGNYKGYYYEFVDTMTHLTYVADSAEVTVDGTVCKEGYTVSWDASAKKLSVKFDDLKQVKDASGSLISVTGNTKVVVTCKATLDADAVIGSTGNPNEVYLKYANNPYVNGDGKNNTGETPKDKNIVFTYKFIANKVDQSGQKLAGAAFELFKQEKDNSWKSLGVIGAKKNSDGTYTLADLALTSFEWTGLDDGTYKLVEVVTPENYNPIADQIFTVTAAHDETSDNPQLTDLTGEKADGSVIAMTPNTTDGSLTTDIVNRIGSQLPSTGGIGTKIFYVLGAVLVLVAGVLLITRKRMHE